MPDVRRETGGTLVGVLKGVTWIVIALLMTVMACFSWGRLRPASDAEAQALASLRPSHPPAQGRNAWATFWLLDYDMPLDQIDRVYAREQQQLIDWAGRLDPADSAPTAYAFPVAATYPKQPQLDQADRERLCRSADADCLGKLRRQADPARDVLAREARRLQGLRSITAADFLWDDTPPNPYTPLPAFAPSADLLRTAAALDFIDGRREQGLDAMCRHAHTVRQLHARTNSLIGSMVMVSWMDSAQRLIAGMLVEWPAGQPVPAACAQAFAPVTPADVDMCAPMQREFAMSSASLAVIDAARAQGTKRYVLHLITDVEAILRMVAPRYAWACQADTRDAMLADRPLADRHAPQMHVDIFDRVSNAAGIILARLAPDYAKYLNRNEDFAASLRLSAWLLHARESATPAAAMRQELAQQSSTAQTPRRYRIDPDGRHVRMQYYAPSGHRKALVWPIAP